MTIGMTLTTRLMAINKKWLDFSLVKKIYLKEKFFQRDSGDRAAQQPEFI
jgi:hypothetical protein